MLALWRGWLPSVIGVVPYVGLNFGVYETLKDVIIKMYGERSLSVGGEVLFQFAAAAMVYETLKDVIIKMYGEHFCSELS